MRSALLMALLACGCGRLDFAPHADEHDAATSDTSSTQDILAGCALHLEMNEASWAGTGAVIDSCKGFRGTASGNASIVTDPTRGSVGNFVGDTSCVMVPDDPVLRGGSAMTISAWVRPAQLSPSGFGVVAKRTDFQVNSEYAIFLWADTDGAGNTNELYVDIDTQRAPDNTTVYANNSWHQFTAVYDGSLQLATVYVDGVRTKTLPEPSTITPSMTEADLAIGCLPLNGPAQGLVGELDKVVIWNRALSSQDAATWYEQTVK